MNFKNTFIITVVILFSIGTIGRTKATPTYFSEESTLEDKELSVTARVYTAAESETILKTDLVAKGYVPVEITIQNPGHHTYAISMASTAMNSAHPKDIAWKESVKGIPRAIAFKVLSFVFWPFNIVSTIDSIVSFKNHTRIVKVLSAKGFKEEDEIVLPYSMVKRVLYIPTESYYQTFSVSLQDLHSDELVVIPVVTA